MKMTGFIALSAITVAIAVGCNQAKSPSAVENDVAKARSEASNKNAKALDKQARVDNSATKSMTDASANTSVAEAEGNYKVAVAKCEALSGDRQQACKDEASAALDMAKAKAKAMKADHP
jgi:CO dehydrogenase/acetyl-CoA synthase alpha subunit